MYVSHKYNLIFVRPPKTAGTSIEQFLIENLADPDAIYSPDITVKRPGSLDDSITKKYLDAHEYKHMTLQQLLDEGIVNGMQATQYDVFCVIRNPIDRQLSSYLHMKRYYFPGDISVEDYRIISNRGQRMRGVPYTDRQQVDYIKLNNKIVGKFWLYEDIETQVSQYLLSKGITPGQMPNYLATETPEPLFEQSDIDDIKALFPEDFEIYANM